MKVLHISTYDIGGAGSAALRLHKGLMNAGVDSSFICLSKHTNENNVFQINEKYISFRSKVSRKLSSIFNSFGTLKEDLHIGNNFEIFSCPDTDYRLNFDPRFLEADLINLHWVADYLDYRSFFRFTRKPIVWTLHDKNPTMGGFHLLLDKEKNQNLADLDFHLQEKKRNYISRIDSLHIVSPSKFLLSYSLESQNLGNFPHYHIPNSINTSIFRPFDKSYSKDLFNLPTDKKIILFLDSESPHKGTNFILDSFKNENYENLQFVALGKALTSDFEYIINIETIVDERLLSLLYNAADYFLIPSIEDNLPNMMLESLACGTPVIGFPTGGIVDTLSNGFNGYLTKDCSAIEFSSIFKKINSEACVFNRDEIRKFAVDNFSLEVQARNYINLYKNILSKQTN